MHIINDGFSLGFKDLSSFNAQLTVDRFDFANPLEISGQRSVLL
jgi:hypothetical protein